METLQKGMKRYWPIIAIIAIVVLGTRALAQTEPPDASKYILNELLNLEDKKRTAEAEVERLDETLGVLTDIKANLEDLSYPPSVPEALTEALPGDEYFYEDLDNATMRFYDPFFAAFEFVPYDEDAEEVLQVTGELSRALSDDENEIKDSVYRLQNSVGKAKNPQQAEKLMNDRHAEVQVALSSEAFDETKEACSKIVEAGLTKTRKDLEKAKKELTNTKDEIAKLRSSVEASKQQEEKKQDLDEILFTVGLPAIIALILILTAINEAPRVIKSVGMAIARIRGTDRETIVNGHTEESDNQMEVLNIITVLLLIIAVLVLGARGQMTETTLGTLIGSIAGFVLGNQSKKEKTPPPKPND